MGLSPASAPGLRAVPAAELCERGHTLPGFGGFGGQGRGRKAYTRAAGDGGAGSGAGPVGSPQTPGHGAFRTPEQPWTRGGKAAAVCCSDPKLREGEIKLRKDKHYFKSDLKD